ncbi:MAG: glycosyltransferase family 1 protein [Bacteroidota bacterium]|nr:glycosyltransferase family 1 protein [Bacteroidota bacterium]
MINAEPLDRQQAGIHYYLKFLRMGFRKYFPEYPINYLRDTDKNLELNDVALRSASKMRRDPLKHFVRIPAYVKNISPDIYLELSHFGPFRLPSSVKIVSVIHDLTPLKFPEYHPCLPAMFQKYFIRHSVKLADVVVANSENTRKDILNEYPEAKDKTVCIYPSIEDDFVRKDPGEVLGRLGIRKQYFLSLSTIEPRKNIGTLLKAFTLFKKGTGSDRMLVLAGKAGWKNSSFNSMLSTHPYRKDILLTGYLERGDLPALYTGAEAFVFPSLYEGFGFPVLEALKCETPCIVSNASSLTEVGGEAVLYFNPHSVSELSEKMIEISRDQILRNEMRAKSRKQAAKFTLKDFAGGFVRLFDELNVNV